MVVWKVWLVAMAMSVACGGGGGSGGFREPLPLIGWFPGDTFHLLDPADVDYAASKRVGIVGLEWHPSVQEHEGRDWRRGDLLISYPEIAEEWGRRACKNGQVLLVYAINWNMTPFRKLDDDWARDVFEDITKRFDPACTWLSPLIEPDEPPFDKAERWTRMAAEIWPGVIVMGAAGEHWNIRRDYVDRHPRDARQAASWLRQAPPGWMIVTDGGTFVNPPDVLEDYPELVRLALGGGIPFVAYTDRWLGDHRAVIDSLAAGIANEGAG
jgi:hypothetical protein